MFKKMLFSLLTLFATLSASPKAIVFDFGGVMTTEPKREAVVQFLRASFNLSAEEFELVNQEKRQAIKAGKSDIEFWLQYAQRHNIALPNDWVSSLNQVMKDAIGVNPQMYALVEELKAKNIRIALLSNIDERLAKLIRDFGLYEPFSPCLLSCEIGLKKPDPKVFEILLTQLNLLAREVVFIDDHLENIEAARNLGIDAILFESYQQLRKELFKRDLLKGLEKAFFLSTNEFSDLCKGTMVQDGL